MEKSSGLADSFSCRCKACKHMIAFDRIKPLPKIWICPRCGCKNYTKPKPIV